jgi:lysozyme
MHISERGIALITSFEGYSARPYGPPQDVWTIGYGHTEGVGPRSGPLTRAQAIKLLRHDLAVKYEPPVQYWQKHLNLNQNEFDALVSACYNLGSGIFNAGKTMGGALRSGNRRRIADAFLVYDMPGSIFHAGLRRRRLAERALFLKPGLTRDQRLVAGWKARLARVRAEANHRKAKHLTPWTPGLRALAKSLEANIKRHS